MEFSPSSLVKKIRLRSEYKGQKAFAKKMGVSVQTVSRWENGKMIPPYYQLEEMLLLVDIRLADLLKLPDEPSAVDRLAELIARKIEKRATIPTARLNKEKKVKLVSKGKEAG